MKVEIYSDVACPWCYIGERRFQQALEQFDGASEVEVVFRPFQLEPDAPETAEPLKARLAKRYGTHAPGMLEQAGAAAAREGIEVDWEGALAVNTLSAHRLLGLAEREHGSVVQRELAEKLFEAHFTRALDIADREVLVGLAASAGLNPERVRTYLASDEGLRETREEIRAALRLGIRAVPTFVLGGRRAVQGAQPPETFLRVLRELAGDGVGRGPTRG